MEADRVLRDSICTTPPVLENGHYLLPTEPGLGTDLDFAAIEGQQTRSQPTRYSTRSVWH
jgi:galactonate dehydratase